MTGGFSSFKGGLGVRKIRARGPGMAWKLANFPHWFRGAWRVVIAYLAAFVTHLPFWYGRLEAVVIKADGTRVNFGTLSYRVVTTAFCADIVDNLQTSASSFANYDYHDAGTGNTAESSADTGLVTPYGGSRASGTPSEPTSVQYRSVGTVSFTSTLAIVEHGLFNASTSGTLMDRSVFSAINVVSGDSIQFTYTLTCTAGG